jgi:hypothetical protein
MSMARGKGKPERNDSPATGKSAGRSLPAAKVTTADQLKDKLREIRERVDAASEPAGPLTLIFGVNASST